MLKRTIIIIVLSFMILVALTNGLPVPSDEPTKTVDLFGWGGGGGGGGHHHGGHHNRPIQNMILGWIGRWIGQQVWQGVFG